MGLPTNWVVIDAAWGEGRKHLYCPDHEALTWYATEAEARKEADDRIQEGTKMVVIAEIKALMVAKAIPYEELV